MQENPVISDWVPGSGGSTEGSLGEWLAQRQAALRGMLAAGAHPTFPLGHLCVPVLSRAHCVPQNLSGNLRELILKGLPVESRQPTENSSLLK